MPSERAGGRIAVFDLGGTWFRWGLFDGLEDLIFCRRVPAISYLSHPALTVPELQQAMTDFIVQRVQEMRDSAEPDLRLVSVAIGAPVNVHDEQVLGSGPLWGPTAEPFHLRARLQAALPDLECHVVNDITALLAPYMVADSRFNKTLLITVSSGIGGRLFDHRRRRIPYDPTRGVQGEIGHLTVACELEGAMVSRQCECGGWNHLNAIASGRGIARLLSDLPALTPRFAALFADAPDRWQRESDEYRWGAFRTQLDLRNGAALQLLEAFVGPLGRILATALAMDPEIDRIVMTGGVAHGLGIAYREALCRTFARDGLYQITDHDPHYLTRRLQWNETDDFAGLRGAGIYFGRHLDTLPQGAPDVIVESRAYAPTRQPACARKQ
jgi:2-epi-5-epi-valiolone 7-kinase